MPSLVLCELLELTKLFKEWGYLYLIKGRKDKGVHFQSFIETRPQLDQRFSRQDLRHKYMKSYHYPIQLKLPGEKMVNCFISSPLFSQ